MLLLLAVVMVGCPVAAVDAPPVPENYGQAMRWYFRAAEAGDPEAQFLLGKKFEDGVNVERDLNEARVWFTKAAEQGHAQAQFKLGVLYETGEGGPGDPALAVRWYEASARQGYAPAQYNLGVAYLNGTGVDSNPIQALAWLSVAAGAGVDESATLRRRLLGELPEADVIEAERIADDIRSGSPEAPR